jgi:hypothetical protein
MNRVEAQTFQARIYVAGPQGIAEQVCREYCYEVGLCVTVEGTRFIYTGGEETGVVVGLVNYPRFQSSGAEVSEKANALAEKLLVAMHQHSALVVGPERTIWMTRREI